MDGRLLFGHYAFMPNRLGYCGGDDSRTLLDYCVAGEADAGTEQIIRGFQAAYPYLCFISESTGVNDPYDPRVVEAYWLGNDLLNEVSMTDFYHYLADKIGPRVPRKAFDLLVNKAPTGARPHHSFHVFDVSMRTGALRESVEDLDRCRISWGSVARVDGNSLTVVYSPLVLSEGILALGEPKERLAFYKAEGRGYLDTPKPGDVVSMHWDWVCDVLSPSQITNLERQTQYHLAIANQTI